MWIYLQNTLKWRKYSTVFTQVHSCKHVSLQTFILLNKLISRGWFLTRFRVTTSGKRFLQPAKNCYQKTGPAKSTKLLLCNCFSPGWLLFISQWTSTRHIVKGVVHPEMKIQSLSPNPHANGRSGQAFLIHKTPLEFYRKKGLQSCPTNIVNRDWIRKKIN